ncbi:GAF domain-containing protein [Leptospira ryugenii]|uniref:GAF domain-containing protein n=1 Tax=Leptospira ryugenii TaxID=1917863 RepID=A0A2P2E0Y9_9LEPT|nr:GAF domain-containing protein [Leptospira ryugenii]
MFDEWENDAKKEAAKQPIQPVEEDKAPTQQQFLFDDESDFSTAPMGSYIASKKRIENYQAVFEITKEIAASKDFAEFFENLAYSIMGQVGCSSVVILSSTQKDSMRWDALNAEGVDLQDHWSFLSGDEVYQRLWETDTVMYAGDLLQRKLPEKESKILGEMESEILAPIRHKEKCYGMISLGRLINDEEYIVDDLEFVKIVGEIAGSVFERVSELEEKTEETSHLKEVIEINESVLKTARDFASVRKLDEAYDLLSENLKKKLGVKQFSFLILDSEKQSDYVVFGSNFILPERAKDFKLSKDSDIVGMISNISGVYRLENFRDDSELKSIFTNDELAIMSEFTILPLINLNWLVGMVVVHSTSKPWTDVSRDIAVAIMETSAPVFANLLILSEKEALYRNPFNPLESRILSEIEKAESLKISFTVVMFKIQNIARITQLFGAGKFARYADLLRKTILEQISEYDFFTRVGQGKFAVVLHGKDREEAEVVMKKIKASIGKKEEFFSPTFKPTYRVLSLTYPVDTKDKNQFMEMIEEA